MPPPVVLHAVAPNVPKYRLDACEAALTLSTTIPLVPPVSAAIAVVIKPPGIKMFVQVTVPSGVVPPCVVFHVGVVLPDVPAVVTC